MNVLDSLLQIKQLSVEVAGSPTPVRILDGCNLELRQGEVRGLIGEGGSGKSVLSRALLRLVPAPLTIVGGTVLYEGRDLLSMPELELNRFRGRLALIPPNGRSLLNPTTTVGSQIALMYQIHKGIAPERSKELVFGLLARVGIPDPERRAVAYPHELSGGMAQRVVVAIALACGPRLLIADEMTANLDVTVQAQVLDVLQELVEEEHLTVLYVTRDLGIVAHYCTTVSVIHQGQITETQSVADFFRRPLSSPGQRIRDSVKIAWKSVATMSADFVDASHAVSRVQGSSTTSDHVGPAPVLEVENLVKYFRSPRTREIVHAVNDVSLRLYAGDTLGLVGESGSGKTTVGRCILGLVEPDAGKITALGQQLVGRRLPQGFRKDVQVVFQDPYESLNPRWSIRRILSDPCRLLLGQSGGQVDASVRVLLDLVELPKRVLDKYPHELTGGIQQLVGIARAMATEPKVLVLDEPTSRLDLLARQRVIDVLRRIRHETGVSYLLISHDLVAVKSISTRLAVMYLGRIVEQGPGEEVFSSPKHPYTCALLSAVLEPTPGMVSDRFSLVGEIPSPIDMPSGCYLHPRCPVATSVCSQEWPDLTPRGKSRREVACLRVPEDSEHDWSPWDLLASTDSAARDVMR